MANLDKKSLTQQDICTKFITPAVKRAGWDKMSQIREAAGFTKGRIIIRGKLVTRGKAKGADYFLYYEPNIPIALIEELMALCDPLEAQLTTTQTESRRRLKAVLYEALSAPYGPNQEVAHP